MNPEQLRYTKTHEWVHVDDAAGERIATVGITAFALEVLTDLVFIQLPEAGEKVEPEGKFGEVESVKAVSDLYSPVEGEVVEVNQAVVDDLEKLTKDPFGGGWVIKVKLSGDAGLDRLLDFTAYQKQCQEEANEH